MVVWSCHLGITWRGLIIWRTRREEIIAVKLELIKMPYEFCIMWWALSKDLNIMKEACKIYVLWWYSFLLIIKSCTSHIAKYSRKIQAVAWINSCVKSWFFEWLHRFSSVWTGVITMQLATFVAGKWPFLVQSSALCLAAYVNVNKTKCFLL